MAYVRKGTTATWTIESSSLTAIDPAGAAAALTLTGMVFNFQSLNIQRKAQKGMLKNSSGSITGAAYTGGEVLGQVDIVPSAATLTLLKTTTAALQTPQGAKITFVDEEDTVNAGAGKSYIMEDVNLKRTNDVNTPLMVSITFWNSADQDISADASLS